VGEFRAYPQPTPGSFSRLVDETTRCESPHHRTACRKLRFASRYSLLRLEIPLLSHKAFGVPLRKAPPLALSGIFEQGNIPCYNRITVQPGKAMTVKEMGLAVATRRAFSLCGSKSSGRCLMVLRVDLDADIAATEFLRGNQRMPRGRDFSLSGAERFAYQALSFRSRIFPRQRPREWKHREA
jgi:hypothetical protein